MSFLRTMQKQPLMVRITNEEVSKKQMKSVRLLEILDVDNRYCLCMNCKIINDGQT